MKKILVLIFFLILSLFSYYNFFYDSNKKIDPISIVPSSAIIVHEIYNPISKWKKLETLFKNDSIFLIKTLSQKIGFIDTILDSKVEKLFINNKLVSSIHLISKSDFDFIFFLDISMIDKEYLFKKLLKNNYSIKKRVFKGYEIHDLIANNESFSFFFYKNLFIGSHSSILIEDVIRTKNNINKSFNKIHSKLFEYVKIKNDFGDIYINSNKIESLLNIFINNKEFQLKNFDNYFDETFLDLSINKNKISLNGFSTNNSKKKLTSIFTNDASDKFSFQNLIPNNCLWIYHISLNQEDNIVNNWTKILQLDTKNLEKNYNKRIIENIDNEFGLLRLERNLKDEENKLLIIKSKDSKIFDKIIKEANENIEELFVEKYHDKIISEVGNNISISKLLQSEYDNLFNVFYVAIDNYIIISGSIDSIKEYLEKVNKQEIWSKSLFYNDIISDLNKQSNINLLINIPKTLIFLLSKINNNNNNNNKKLISVFNNFDFLSIQFTKIENKFYTSLVLKNSKLSRKDFFSDYDIVTNLEINLNNKIITKPHLIRNHSDNSIEVIAQDKLNNIYQISSKLKRIWHDSISSSINSKVYQIDYYKNTKKQIVFSTENKIYAYDRRGNNLTEYPLKNPSSNKIDYFNIIDYDNSKNYRLVIADIKGNIYLKDKTGKNLEGWNPLMINNPLSESPFHIRISKKDYIIVVEKEGGVNLLNRKGENYKGFPLNFNSGISNNIFVEKKSNKKNSTITLLLDNGKLIKFNLNGEIIKENQLFRPSINSRFYLLTDPNKKNYKIIVRDESSVHIFENEKIKFKQDFFNTENLNFQYYYFGGAHELIAILNKKTQSILIYDFRGELVSKNELPADQLISILYYESKNEYKVYSILNNKLSLTSLKI